MGNKQWADKPAMGIDQANQYRAIIDTDKGEMVFELAAAKTPLTVNNFVFLAREGYYDNTIFHRVIEDFMVQGGDPTGTGRGGPGYQFKDEFVTTLRHDKRGVLSMANAGPGTNGSQFFITHGPTPWLDGKHTVFGQLVAGEKVLMSIPARDPMRIGSPAVTIKTIRIEEIKPE